MRGRKSPVERLDLLLACLEDEVLRSESEKNAFTECTIAMRSEIEALIQANSNQTENSELEENAGMFEARGMTARMISEVTKWTDVSPRVRMAFSGTRPAKASKSEDRVASQDDIVSDDEHR